MYKASIIEKYCIILKLKYANDKIFVFLDLYCNTIQVASLVTSEYGPVVAALTMSHTI